MSLYQQQQQQQQRDFDFNTSKWSAIEACGFKIWWNHDKIWFFIHCVHCTVWKILREKQTEKWFGVNMLHEIPKLFNVCYSDLIGGWPSIEHWVYAVFYIFFIHWHWCFVDLEFRLSENWGSEWLALMKRVLDPQFILVMQFVPNPLWNPRFFSFLISFRSMNNEHWACIWTNAWGFIIRSDRKKTIMCTCFQLKFIFIVIEHRAHNTQSTTDDIENKGKQY